MPRLHGYNIYDCLFDGFDDHNALKLGAGYLRMFGNANVGNMALTNLHMGGQLVHDASAVIYGWYARTNLPPSPELEAWANATTAEIEISNKLYWQLNLADLLKHPQGDLKLPMTAREQKDKEADDNKRDDLLAGNLYSEFTAGMPPLFGSLDGITRGRWLNVARRAIRELGPPPNPPLILPPRANFSITINTSPAAFAALQKSIPPGSIEPHPRAWIHLEGLTVREVQ